MKKYIFTIATLLSLLPANHCLTMHYDDVRAPIPAKVDQLINNNIDNKPKNFDIIYNVLQEEKEPREKIKLLTEDMGFCINHVVATKEYCATHEYYALSADITQEIDRKYNEETEKIVIAGIDQNLNNKGWGEIREELIKNNVPENIIQNVKPLCQEKQLVLIRTFIEKNIQEKLWTNIEKELLERQFEKKHIDICKAEKQKDLKNAELEKIKAYVQKHIIDKNLLEIEQELLKLPFNKDLVTHIKSDKMQTDIVQNHNKGGKNDQMLKKELLEKGFKKEIVLEMIKKEKAKRLAKLEAKFNTKKKKQPVQQKQISPKKPKKPKQQVPAILKQKQPEQKQPKMEKPNANLGNIIKKKFKPETISPKKQKVPVVNPPANNGDDKNDKSNNSFFNMLGTFIKSKYTLGITAGCLGIMILYKIIWK